MLLTAHFAVATEPPVNDFFNNSVKISGFTNSIAGGLRYATAELGEPVVSGATPSHSLWWSWTAPATGLGVVTLNTASSPVGPDVRVSIFGGTNLSELTLITSTVPMSYQISKGWSVVEGETYHISVGSILSSNTFVGGVDFRYRPANDAFTNRMALTPMTNVVTASNTISVTSSTVNTLYGTREPGEPNVTSSGTPAGNTLWWTWSAPLSGQVSIRVSSSSPVYSRIYTGSSLAELTTVPGTTGPGMVGADTSRIYSFPVRSGSRYEIQTDGAFIGAIEISVSVTLVPAPENDDFVNRTILAGNSLSVSSVVAQATIEPGESFHGNSVFQLQSLWWGWTAPDSEFLTLTVNYTGFPAPRLAVYQGSAVDVLTLITNNQGTNPVRVSFPVTSGVEYQIAVSSSTLLPTPIQLELTRKRPPTIDWSNPTSDVVAALGGTQLLSAVAEDADGSIERVDFFAGGVIVGSDSSPPYSLELTNLAYGTQIISATALDNDGLMTWSRVLLVEVPQENDAFANRFILSGFPVTAYGTNDGATREFGEPLHAGQDGSGSVWWRWMAEQDGPVVVVTRSTDTRLTLGIYTGDSLESLTPIGSAAIPVANDRAVRFNAVAGTEYNIAVDSLTSANGSFFSLLVIPPPSNDLFTNATRLTGSFATASGHNYGATRDIGEPFLRGSSTQSVWWAWTAPYSQPVVVASSTSFRNPALSVFNGTQINQLTAVASELSFANSNVVVGFNATAGTEYRFAVNAVFSGIGEISITLQPATVPLLSFVSRTNGQVTFKLTGVEGLPYRIDESLDLDNWMPFRVVTLVSSSSEFSVPVLPASVGRFYRPKLDP